MGGVTVHQSSVLSPQSTHHEPPPTNQSPSRRIVPTVSVNLQVRDRNVTRPQDSVVKTREDPVNVAIFTDNDFDKVNGVTTTFRAALQSAPAGIHLRVYTAASLQVETDSYLALRSVGVPIPFYSEMQIYLPRFCEFLKRARADRIDLVHLTTPGPIGLAALYVAWRLQLPLIGSFHTDLAAYATLLSGSTRLGALMREYMRWPVRPMCPCPRALRAHAPVADLGKVEPGSGRRVAARRGHDVVLTGQALAGAAREVARFGSTSCAAVCRSRLAGEGSPAPSGDLRSAVQARYRTSMHRRRRRSAAPDAAPCTARCGVYGRALPAGRGRSVCISRLLRVSEHHGHGRQCRSGGTGQRSSRRRLRKRRSAGKHGGRSNGHGVPPGRSRRMGDRGGRRSGAIATLPVLAVCAPIRAHSDLGTRAAAAVSRLSRGLMRGRARDARPRCSRRSRVAGAQSSRVRESASGRRSPRWRARSRRTADARTR